MPTTTQMGIAIAGVLAIGIGAGLGTRGKLPSFRSPTGTNAEMLEHGYFSNAARPDSLKILPPPPAAGSPAFARDEEVRQAALSKIDPARYKLAAADADRGNESTLGAFDCAFGAKISQSDSPALWRLLTKVRFDVRLSTYRAKMHYKRPRPYVVHGAKVCSATEELVRDEGSYPSARAAVAWAHALVLAEINPVRGSELIARAQQFGESRIICDTNWQSDLDAGRILAIEAVRQLHANDEFRKELAGARAEFQGATRAGSRPVCTAESMALASR